MAQKQYKQLGCMDVAPSCGCAFEVRAETKEVVMKLTLEQGKLTQKMSDLPPEMAGAI